MTRFFNPTRYLIVLILTLALTTSCAFEPGEPWGYIEAGISLHDDHLETPPDITINTIQLSLSTLRLYGPASSSGSTQFDPANPPPGYSQCHGGHCHADDGSLPTYAEIEAELSGGTATLKQVAIAHFTDQLTPGNELEDELKIVERGPLTRAQIEISTLVIQATTKRGDDISSLTIDIPLNDTKLSSPIDLVIDRNSPHHQPLELEIELPHDLLADIDLEKLTPQSDGSFLINTKNNPDHAAAIASIFKQEVELFVADDHDHDDHDDHDH